MLEDPQQPLATAVRFPSLGLQWRAGSVPSHHQDRQRSSQVSHGIESEFAALGTFVVPFTSIGDPHCERTFGGEPWRFEPIPSPNFRRRHTSLRRALGSRFQISTDPESSGSTPRTLLPRGGATVAIALLQSLRRLLIIIIARRRCTSVIASTPNEHWKMAPSQYNLAFTPILSAQRLSPNRIHCALIPARRATDPYSSPEHVWRKL